MSDVAVLGGGAWGTALAVHLARNGASAVMWARDAPQLDLMRRAGENTRYLPGVAFPKGLTLDADLQRVVSSARDILVVVPSEAFRGCLETIRPWLRSDARIIWATKGLESSSGQFLHEVIEEELGDIPKAVLSGPSFAAELGRGQPTAVTVASASQAFAQDLVNLFHGGSLRLYTSADLRGVQLGGAVKNVMAIASGISSGLGFGTNARAALITRGLAEIMRLGEALDADRATLMGLSGVGDLVLTCTDSLSRNYRFGLAIGQGDSIHSAKAGIHQVVEGAVTAKVILELAQRIGVELPICELVNRILYQGLAPVHAVDVLLNREQRDEF